MGEDQFRAELRRMADRNGVLIIKEDKLVGVLRRDIDAGAEFVNVFRGSQRNDLLIVTTVSTYAVSVKLLSVKVE